MTEYSYIFDEFKDKITDPDLHLFCEDLQNEMLLAFMRKAISRCSDSIENVDLSLRDDLDMVFEEDLPYKVVDIITEWMVYYWLQPYVNNAENLRNALSTKDFAVFSPANLLKEIGERFKAAKSATRGMMNEYSVRIGDVRKLKS